MLQKGEYILNDKLETISNLFEGNEIRSIWDSEKEEQFFSVIDVISTLTDSKNPSDYWYRLKVRMTEEEKSELSTKCRQLKLKSKDGKYRKSAISRKNALNYKYIDEAKQIENKEGENNDK